MYLITECVSSTMIYQNDMPLIESLLGIPWQQWKAIPDSRVENGAYLAEDYYIILTPEQRQIIEKNLNKLEHSYLVQSKKAHTFGIKINQK